MTSEPTTPPIEPPDALDTFLVGKTLEGGWRIEAARTVARDAITHSRTYLARNATGHPAFVKVLDPRGMPTLAEQQIALDQFAYEDEVIRKCGTRRMRRIVRGIASAQIPLPGPVPVPLRYLVFEWADCDVRSQLDQPEADHVAASLRWLHHAATGLQELHYSKIAHQDLKPANLLIMQDRTARIGDLGRAHDHERPRPNGDAQRERTWAPPEALYAAMPSSFEARCAADMYQLGSLAVFLFSSVGLNALVEREVAPIHSWRAWSGSYEDVLFYLRDYYGQVLERWAQDVPAWLRPRLLTAVRQLTDPDPAKRGHPANIAGSGARYGFERYVSGFDLLAKTAELHRRL